MTWRSRWFDQGLDRFTFKVRGCVHGELRHVDRAAPLMDEGELVPGASPEAEVDALGRWLGD